MRRFPSWLVPSLARSQRRAASRRTRPPRRRPPTRATAAAPAPAGPQAIVTVIYNPPKDPKAFEKYYSETHLPLVQANQQEIGFTKAELTKFVTTLDGKKPTFYRQAELYFNSLDDAKKGMATPGFKKVGDDLASSRPAGCSAWWPWRPATRATAACPALVTVIYNTPKDTRRLRDVLLGDAPAARRRGPAGDRLHPGGPDQVRLEPRRLGAGQVPPGRALLPLDGRAQEGHRDARRSRRWATIFPTSPPAASTALIGEQK